MTRIGIIGDTHIPYELDGYLQWCYDVFDQWAVDRIIHIGDAFDNHALSFHDSEPMLKGVTGEVTEARERASEMYDLFPEATLILGNHDRIPARQLRKIGMEPTIFMKPFEEIYDMPEGWSTENTVQIDDVIYHHGETAGGMNGFLKDAKNRMQCAVSGHNHSNAGIASFATQNELVWGMAVGCGVDRDHMAFAYGKNFPSKPIIACGVVVDGEPHVEFANLGKKIRRAR